MKKKLILKKYFTNSLIIMIASGIFSLSQFLLISMMTKIYGITEVGYYTYALAIITPLATFVGLNLRAVQLTDVKDKFKFGDFFSLRVFGILIMSVVFLMIVISGEHDGNTLFLVISILVIIRKSIELLIEVIHSKLLREKAYKKYSTSLIVIGVLSFLSFITLSFFTENLIISLMFYTLVWLLVFIMYDSKNIKLINEVSNYKLNIRSVYKLIIFSLPLAFVSTMNVLYTNVPRIFIERHLGFNEVGIFSSLIYIGLVGSIFISGITVIFSTKLADINNEAQASKFMKIVMLQIFVTTFFVGIVFLIFSFFGETILVFIFTEEFNIYNNVMLVLVIVLGLGFTAQILGSACTSAQKNKQQFIVALFCIPLLVISSYILIPLFGLYGASISLGITYLLKNILLTLTLFIHFRKVTKT